VLITPSLGVPNWSVIYINTAPSPRWRWWTWRLLPGAWAPRWPPASRGRNWWQSRWDYPCRSPPRQPKVKPHMHFGWDNRRELLKVPVAVVGHR
jgi:hypothetical protein